MSGEGDGWSGEGDRLILQGGAGEDGEVGGDLLTRVGEAAVLVEVDPDAEVGGGGGGVGGIDGESVGAGQDD